MLTPGTKLGTYEIIGPLGAGGMGEVYRAHDLRLGRDVALKVLPMAVARDADRLARFEREARTVAGLNHPNIVMIFSIEEENGTRFMTMELVEGQALSVLVAPGGLPLPRLLELAIPLADALTAAHARGVVHRDLKPENVMVTREGRVKVLDFGLAKPAQTASDLDATQAQTSATPLSSAGQMLGTAPYMSPEQVRGEAVDARTDLFAFGILLYELSSGRRPFSGPTFADLISSILRDVPEPLTSMRADLPADFDRIVRRCLQRRPQDRFQSALELMNDLRGLRRVLKQGSPATPSARPASAAVASIAVLPFVNRSREEEDEYFSDGLADELLNMLAKIKGLRVSARASSFHFKGKDVPLAEVGRALNVATVLDGSVRKMGNRVRISVQLVKVSDGYHLWSETYDRLLDDIFAVQDDIAQSVVKELRAMLLGEDTDSEASGQARAEVAQAGRGRGHNPEAHRLYLQARYLIDRSTREGLAKGTGYLKQALLLDPGFALAWVELGLTYSTEVGLGWADVAEGYARARQAVERSLSLEPGLAEGHAGLGWIRMAYDWDWKGAEASYALALDLAPANATVLRWTGHLSRSLGRLEIAIGYYRRALEQDPLGAAAHNSLGATLHSAGRHEEAESAFRKGLELAPQTVFTRSELALVLLAAGRAEEALKEALQEPEDAMRLHATAIVYHALGRHAESDEAIRALRENHAKVSAYQMAEAHAARGETDPAFEWMERAYEQRDSGLTYVKTSWALRPLKGDPRWDKLLKMMGLAG